jgi:hypothetical protein
MSQNTKYTAAAQRDSLDDSAHYSQPPPSYVDEPSSSSDAALLGGAPRSSEDNIPDDFKVWRCAGLEGGMANVVIVWRFGRRGHHRHPDGVCEKGVCYSVSRHAYCCP